MSLRVDLGSAPAQAGTYRAEVAVTDASTGRLRASIAVSLSLRTPDPLMTTAHRTSGIAPLGVFFDAADTTSPFLWESGVAQAPDARYGRLHYTWEFGDPNSGMWSTDGKSRNVDTGFTAAHVYENPGTYLARLTIEDPVTGEHDAYQQIVTVSAFSGTDYYVDAVNGSDGNDGRSESTAWQTADKAFADGIGTNVRVRFRRGQAFTPSERVTVTAEGPGILGAYGAGARPVLQFPSTVGEFALVFRTNDWRVMELDLLGSGSNTVAVWFAIDARVTNMLLWDNIVRSWGDTSIAWTFWGPVLENPHRGNIVGENYILDCAGGFYVGGRQQALLGNRVESDSADSHSMRIWQAHKAAICHNILRDPDPAGRQALKLHGPIEGTGQLGRTMFVSISDNVFRGEGWGITIGPQDMFNDERISQILFERNRTEASSSIVTDLRVMARHVTIRNNVFNGTGASPYYVAVHVTRWGLEPAPQYVDVYNNTIYRGTAGSEYAMVWVDSAASDVNVRNNIGSAPLVGGPASFRLVVDGTCTNLVTSHNVLTDTPGFESAAEGDFHLTATSPGVDAGLPLPEVVGDFDGKPRDDWPDLGAFER